MSTSPDSITYTQTISELLAPAPVHDWASHPADAFRYLAMAWREIGGVNDNQPGKLLTVGPNNTVSMDDLWELNARKRRARF